MLNKTDYKIVLDKIAKEQYIWKWIPSELADPEFVDCYQSQISLLNSQCFGKHSGEVPNFKFQQLRIQHNNIVLKQRAEFPLLDKIRTIVDSTAPFGKVSVWKILPTGRVNDHTDRWPYHYLVDRFIFNINMNNVDCDIIVNDSKLKSDPGSIVKFALNDRHRLINNQKETIYFMAIDIFKCHDIENNINISNL